MCFEITKVACDPSRRRRGHARRLVAAILNEARRRNAKRVALRVEIANRAAVALYESAGFVEDTSRKRAHEEYSGPGRHGTVYERLF
jgi:ribosomal-protein-alanine N-acetyltransferase